MRTLRLGDRGSSVRKLQQELDQAGFAPGNIDGHFGPGTLAAVIAFQSSEGLLADGVAGPRTLHVLGLSRTPQLPSIAGRLSVDIVSRMFPFTPVANIRRNLPFVLDAARKANLQDQMMLLMALATIRAESERFEPVSEGRSKYNTSPRGHPFDLYDARRDLGNRGAPDGESYRGRGYVQLTGRDNYQRYSRKLGLGQQLLQDPGLANDPAIAAALLMAFLGDKERVIKEALLDRNFRQARRWVNGGVHGLDRFTEAYLIGERLLST